MIACQGRGYAPDYPIAGMRAPRNAWSKLVRLLLEKGASINAIAPQSKMTPLRAAIQYKKFDVLPVLLEYRVKIDIKSRLWLLAHAKDLGLELEKQDRQVKSSRR